MTRDHRLQAILAAQEDRYGAPTTLRHATRNLCPRCDTWTLVGLDDHTLAHTVRVDPTPLTPTGELAALIATRRTYTLTSDGRRTTLQHRDAWDITGHPPGNEGGEYDVLPAHQCEHPFIGTHITESRLPVRMKTVEVSECPF